MTWFVFNQVGNIVKRKRKGAVPAGKEVFKGSSIETGEPFARTDPYKTTAILGDTVDTVIAETVGSSIVLEEYLRGLPLCSAKNNKTCNKNADIPGNSISFIHASKIEKRNHLPDEYAAMAARLVKTTRCFSSIRGIFAPEVNAINKP